MECEHCRSDKTYMIGEMHKENGQEIEIFHCESCHMDTVINIC